MKDLVLTALAVAAGIYAEKKYNVSELIGKLKDKSPLDIYNEVVQQLGNEQEKSMIL